MVELEQKKILDGASSIFYKVMRIKVKRDSDRLKVEKKRLKYNIEDFFKDKEGTRVKIRKIKDF